MNMRCQMQGGKNWILSKENKCKPLLLRLSLARNLENRLCPSMGPNGGSVVSASYYVLYDIRDLKRETRKSH